MVPSSSNVTCIFDVPTFVNVTVYCEYGWSLVTQWLESSCEILSEQNVDPVVDVEEPVVVDVELPKNKCKKKVKQWNDKQK